MADAASGVLSPAKMPRRAAESVAFDAAMYPFPIGVSFWSEMSGLTSSRVNCAKPREQLYGGVAFGAGRFEAARAARLADPDRAAEELWLQAGCRAGGSREYQGVGAPRELETF